MWLVYMSTDDDLLGWLSLATLLLVAALGDVVLVTWVQDRRKERKKPMIAVCTHPVTASARRPRWCCCPASGWAT